MAAITWRNVNGPTVAEAARPLELARQGFQDTFQILGNTLSQAQQARTNAENFRRQAAEAAFLNRLAQIQDVNTFRDQQAALFEQMAGMDPRSQTVLRDQLMNRERQLIDQTQARYSFDDVMAERQGREAVAAIHQHILTNSNTPIPEKLFQQVPVWQRADLLTKLDERRQEEARRAWEKKVQKETEKGWERAEEKHKSDLADSTARRGLYKAQADQAAAGTALARLQIDQARWEAQQREQEALLLAAQNALEKQGNLYSDSLTPERNVDALVKIIDERTDLNQDEKTALRAALARNLTYDIPVKNEKGKVVGYRTIPVPTAFLVKRLQTADRGWLDSSVGTYFTEGIVKDMENPENLARVLDHLTIREQFIQQMLKNPSISRSK